MSKAAAATAESGYGTVTFLFTDVEGSSDARTLPTARAARAAVDAQRALPSERFRTARA